MKKYTQKKSIQLNRRRGIFLNNNMLSIKNNNNFGFIIGIYANRNIFLTQEQINTIKQDLNNPSFFEWGGKLNKFFNIIINIKPNKIITNKGILVRMGKGKGKIKTKGILVIKNTICILLKQKKNINNKILKLINNSPSNSNILKLIFNKFLKKHTYFSIKSNI